MTLSLVSGGCLQGVDILRDLPKRPGGTVEKEEGRSKRFILTRRRMGRNAQIILE